jgi:hypothetical protein
MGGAARLPVWFGRLAIPPGPLIELRLGGLGLFVVLISGGHPCILLDE